MSTPRRRGRGAMSAAEAAVLTGEIEKWRRFRVTGRRVLEGAGVRLQVTDQSTGFRHDIHDAEQWREVMSWAYLNVYGTLEDALVDALGKFQEDAESALTDPKGRRRYAVLQHAKVGAERLLRQMQDQSYGLAVGRTYLAPDGDGTIAQRKERRFWQAFFRVDGRLRSVSSDRSAEACAQKLAAAEAGATTNGHAFASAGGVRPRIAKASYVGGIWAGGRRRWVSGSTYELCRQRLDALRAELASSGWRPRRSRGEAA